MSFYRFVRFTALVTLARRYQRRLVRIVFTASFAWVTSWQYADIALFLDQRHPEWTATALLTKTVIVYAALLLVFWELARMLRGDDGRTRAKKTVDSSPLESAKPRQKTTAATASTSTAPSTRLDQLAEKPKLRQRRDEILRRD